MNAITSTVKVIIADDHHFFRKGFKQIVKEQLQNSIDFIGEASDGFELMEAIHANLPDVVITDIRMPRMNGIEACRQIKSLFPSIKVLAMSYSDEISHIMGMYQAGANGYLLKNITCDEVMDALSIVQDDMPYYCNTLREKVFGNFTINKLKRTVKNPIQFSAQETEIIKLICRQSTTKEIAHILKLSTRTIDDHRQNIQEKTGAKNAVGIAIFAIVNEVVKLEELRNSGE